MSFARCAGPRRRNRLVHTLLRPSSGPSRTDRITFAGSELDALLEHLAAEGIDDGPIETCSNGVRHVKIPDPDGNAIAFAEPPA